MPLGTDGMVPKLSLVYDSQGGSTYFGQGWSLMGLSHITRTNKDHYRDGWAKSPELETFGDAFTLDGARLILVSGRYGKDGSTYRTESETFSKIILHEALISSGSWFEVVAKTGVITHYAAGYKSVDGAYILTWHISKVIDPNGNYMAYKYDFSGNEMLLKTIVYTGNLSSGLVPYNFIELNYHNQPEERVDKNTVFIKNREIHFKSVLKDITIRNYEPTNEIIRPLKRYTFEYAKSSGGNTTKTNTTNAVRFEPQPTVYDFGGHEVVETSCQTWDGVNHYKDIQNTNSIISTVSDFDGDGSDDVITVVTEPRSLYSLTNDLVGGYLGEKIKGVEIMTKLTTGIQRQFVPMPQAPSEWVGFNTIAEYGYAWDDRGINVVEVGDYDGDGRADIAIITRSQLFWNNVQNTADLFSLINAWTTYTYDDVFTCSTKIKVHIGLAKDNFSLKPVNFDTNGDLTTSGVHYAGFPALGPGWGLLGSPAILQFATNDPMPSGAQPRLGFEYEQLKKITTRTVDFDGDRKSELLINTVDGMFVYAINETFSNETRGYTLYNRTGNGDPTDLAQKAYFADFNGDGKTDMFFPEADFDVRDGGTGNINYSTGTSYKHTNLPNVGLSPDYINSRKYLVADFNGDGKSDIMTATYYNYNEEPELTS